MISTNLCSNNLSLGIEISDFITNVSDVKEESITDYLVWKWRLLDKRIKFLTAKTFSRQMESSTTGADFELELWLVGRRRSIPILCQAKKFLKPFDSYVRKFNYPNNSRKQLNTLLKYSKSKKLIPFYIIYTSANSGFTPLCKMKPNNSTGIYMLDAHIAHDIAIGAFGKKVSLTEILGHSNPFHCLFCCPIMTISKYIESYFPSLSVADYIRDNDDLPLYVQALLFEQQVPIDISTERTNRGEAQLPRLVGIYDLRNEEIDI